MPDILEVQREVIPIILSSQKLSAQPRFVPDSLVVTSSDTEAGGLACFTERFMIVLRVRYLVHSDVIC